MLERHGPYNGAKTFVEEERVPLLRNDIGVLIESSFALHRENATRQNESVIGMDVSRAIGDTRLRLSPFARSRNHPPAAPASQARLRFRLYGRKRCRDFAPCFGLGYSGPGCGLDLLRTVTGSCDQTAPAVVQFRICLP